MGISNTSKIKAATVYYLLIPALLVSLLIISLQLIANAEERVEINSQLENSRDVISDEEILKQIDISKELIYDTSGIASHYAKRFHKRRTANGERFNMYKFSAAHRNLPFGTILRVTNLGTNKKVLVRINDRGPYVGKRILDLSYESAKHIGDMGLPNVKIEGFLDKKFLVKDIKDTSQSYLYAYSYDKELMCIPETFVSITDTLNNFNAAVKKYANIDDPEAFLFVHAGKKVRRQTKKSDSIYYIGKINKNRLTEFKEEVLLAGI